MCPQARIARSNVKVFQTRYAADMHELVLRWIEWQPSNGFPPSYVCTPFADDTCELFKTTKLSLVRNLPMEV